MRASAPSMEIPWSGHYPPGVHWDQPLALKPLYAVLDESVARWPRNPAFDFLGRSYTYAQLGDLVDRAAAGFRQLGVRRGTRVAICLPNCPFQVISFYAVLKAGGVVVNVNPLYTGREISALIADAQAEIVVTLDLRQVYFKVRQALDEGLARRVVVCRMRGCLPSMKSVLFRVLKRSEVASIPDDLRHLSFADLLRHGKLSLTEPINPETDLAVLQYTGGTTGTAKGAMLTHGNLVANTQQLMAWMPDLRGGQEKILAVLPFFHVFAMTVVLNVGIAVGAELVLLPRFDMREVLRALGKQRPTLVPGVPTIYTAINGARDLQKHDLSSVRFCISGGAPLPLEVKEEFERLTGCILVEGYGLTEASPVVTCNPLAEGDHGKPGAIGLPIPGTRVEIRSLSDPRQCLHTGERGEVCVRGPQVMHGYWQRPEDTAEVLIDGWLRTGDVGYMDDDGYVFLVDRIKDIILSGGYNIYPRMIEDAIYLHPAVAEVAVIGVPDTYRGQRPKAFIRLRKGHSLDEATLRAFLADKLSRIEMPRHFEFREELPTTMVGKLSKKALQEEEEERRRQAARAPAEPGRARRQVATAGASGSGS